MKRVVIFFGVIVMTLFTSGCVSSSTSSSESSPSKEGSKGSSGEKVEVVKEEAQQKDVPFEIDDFVLSVTPSGEIDSAGGVYYSYEVENNSPVAVKELSLEVKFEFEEGDSSVDTITIRDTLMKGESVGGARETVYPDSESPITSYQLISYEVVDDAGVYYLVDLQLETVEVRESYASENSSDDIPFELDDIVLEITPSGEIDSAGGVYYSYAVENNSSIPVKEMRLNVKLEFEDGQNLVETISVRDTIMDGESMGGSRLTVYPDPESHISSYQLIGYELIDSEGATYVADLQLETVDVMETSASNNVVEDVAFKIDDFVLTVKPSGEIDSAGGVYYSYEIENNSSIPAKEMILHVKFEFENGASLVDRISVRDTLMNGESTGNSRQTVYPDPATKIKSYQLIGFEITDKDDQTYLVDTQLNLVQEE